MPVNHDEEVREKATMLNLLFTIKATYLEYEEVTFWCPLAFIMVGKPSKL